MKYEIIYCDPPWSYKVWSKKGEKKCASAHYDTMTIDDICALPVKNLAAKDCALFMWVTSPTLPDALRAIESWGFTYKTLAFCWVKQNKGGWGLRMGLGYYTRSNVELCLLATIGHPKRVNNSVQQTVFSPLRKHSQKPDEVRDKIVDLMGDLPRVELFARQRAEGWDAVGDEIDGRDIRESLVA